MEWSASKLGISLFRRAIKLNLATLSSDSAGLAAGIPLALLTTCY